MHGTKEKVTTEAEDPEFGKRVQKALDLIPDVPTDYGRQKWLVDEIERVSGKSFSPWAVSKWVRGLARPRYKNMEILAQALRVDPAWLSAGRSGVERAQRVDRRQALAPGALNLVVGMMQIMGATVALPKAGEDESSFTAVVDGQTYSIAVPVAEQRGADTVYQIPRYAREVTYIAPIAHSSGTGFDFLYLSDALVAEHATRKSAYREIVVKRSKHGYTAGKAVISPIKSLKDLEKND